MCIAAGCDYLKNIFGIGISRAYSLVSSGNDLLELLAEKGATKEYQEGFDKAEAVFQHQTVFDISCCTTVPLKMWESDPPIGIQFLCGKYPLLIIISLNQNNRMFECKKSIDRQAV